MKNTKTQKDFYKEGIEMAEKAGNTELADFFKGRIEMIEKKASSKGETAKQKENEIIKDIVLAKLETLNEKATVTELLQDREINEKVNGSNQKLTALLTQLKKENKITNIKEGKKSFYVVA